MGVPELRAIRAVLVSVDNKSVIDHYRASKPSEYAQVFSVTKSVISILVGIALDEGHVRSLDQTLGESLPKYRLQMADHVAAITLRQLLTQISAIPGNQSYSGGFALAADDAVRLISLGLLNEPGSCLTTPIPARIWWERCWLRRPVARSWTTPVSGFSTLSAS